MKDPQTMSFDDRPLCPLQDSCKGSRCAWWVATATDHGQCAVHMLGEQSAYTSMHLENIDNYNRSG